jgi:hypothetical protein
MAKQKRQILVKLEMQTAKSGGNLPSRKSAHRGITPRGGNDACASTFAKINKTSELTKNLHVTHYLIFSIKEKIHGFNHIHEISPQSRLISKLLFSGAHQCSSLTQTDANPAPHRGRCPPNHFAGIGGIRQRVRHRSRRRKPLKSGLHSKMVRVAGLEPALLAKADFESAASTIPPHPHNKALLVEVPRLRDWSAFGSSEPAGPARGLARAQSAVNATFAARAGR